MIDTSSLKKLAADMRQIPRVAAIRICEAAAPELTRLGHQTFAASEDAYGDSWEVGADGKRVTLRKSGALERQLYYVAIGAKLRVALGVPYAKYQIGKRPVFPRQGEDLPVAYAKTLQRIAIDTLREVFG